MIRLYNADIVKTRDGAPVVNPRGEVQIRVILEPSLWSRCYWVYPTRLMIDREGAVYLESRAFHRLNRWVGNKWQGQRLKTERGKD